MKGAATKKCLNLQITDSGVWSDMGKYYYQVCSTSTSTLDMQHTQLPDQSSIWLYFRLKAPSFFYLSVDQQVDMLHLSPQRHFSVFALSFPGAEALNTIYSSILSHHLRGEGFAGTLQKSCPTLVQLALAMHQRISSTFLPTALKFHYIFNLRDLSNIFQVIYC